MSYFVGPDRKEARTMQEAYRFATEKLKSRRLGDSVNIYSKPTGSYVVARIEVRPDSKGQLRFVAYIQGCKYGRSITCDYQAKGEYFPNIHQRRAHDAKRRIQSLFHL